MTQTNNPPLDTRSPRCSKSLLIPELKKRLGQQAKSGYSCNMIIIDDVADEPPTPEQKASMLKLYQDHVDSKILSAFRIPETTAKAEAANTADLQSKLIARKLNEELHAKFGILYANTQL